MPPVSWLAGRPWPRRPPGGRHRPAARLLARPAARLLGPPAGLLPGRPAMPRAALGPAEPLADLPAAEPGGW